MPKMKQQIGQEAEKIACDYLLQQGLQFITQNYRDKQGEIDLIMRDNTTMIFVEVRSKQSDIYGSPIESITPHKQQKIARTALSYLQKQKLLHQIDCRFDIIGIHDHQIEWIQNAFTYNHFY